MVLHLGQRKERAMPTAGPYPAIRLLAGPQRLSLRPGCKILVADSVECAECGTRYDSDVQAFCPRCGGLRQGTPMAPAVTSAARRLPSRRRVQVGGVILAATSGVFFVLAVVGFFAAGSLTVESLQLLDGAEGGAVEVRVVSGGEGVAGARVELQRIDGEAFANGTTDENGTVRLSAKASALNRVQVTYENQSWHRRVFAGPGAVRSVEFDVAAPPGALPDVLQTKKEVSQVRMFAGMAAAFMALGIAGGIAAIRLRPRNVAVAGAIAGLAPVLLLVFAVPAAGLVPALLMGLAAALILPGRGAFTR
jgi:hypothetical protein